MGVLRTRSIVVAIAATLWILPASSDAGILHLRSSTAECGGLSPCVTSMADVQAHITANPPSSASPLTVDIGPGSFDAFTCFSGGGHIQLRGAGRTQTTVGGALVVACDELEFRDLRFERDQVHTVFWIGGGSSTWMQVDIVAPEFLAAWYDSCGFLTPSDPGVTLGKHTFFDVHIDGGIGFFSQCSENWLWGSDVTGRGVGVDVSLRGDVRLFGSSVRVKPQTLQDTQVTPPNGVAGVRVGLNPNNSGGGVVTTGKGNFHMHGGAISVDATLVPEYTGDVVGLEVSGEMAHAHTPDTAFVLRAPPAATPVRLRGMAESPFLWSAGETPPTAASETNRLESEDGHDLFVETDCGDDGDCTAGGSRAHLMIYNPTACPAEGWLDAVTGRCRNTTAP